MRARGAETYKVELSGDLTIRAIGAVHDQIVEALGAHASVIADVAPEAAVDLTFVQLMESARRSAGEAGADFGLAAPAAGALLATLQRGGFLADAPSRQFWLLTPEAL